MGAYSGYILTLNKIILHGYSTVQPEPNWALCDFQSLDPTKNDPASQYWEILYMHRMENSIKGRGILYNLS